MRIKYLFIEDFTIHENKTIPGISGRTGGLQDE
jgi:hypothetical protein